MTSLIWYHAVIYSAYYAFHYISFLFDRREHINLFDTPHFIYFIGYYALTLMRLRAAPPAHPSLLSSAFGAAHDDDLSIAITTATAALILFAYLSALYAIIWAMILHTPKHTCEALRCYASQFSRMKLNIITTKPPQRRDARRNAATAEKWKYQWLAAHAIPGNQRFGLPRVLVCLYALLYLKWVTMPGLY